MSWLLPKHFVILGIHLVCLTLFNCGTFPYEYASADNRATGTSPPIHSSETTSTAQQIETSSLPDKPPLAPHLTIAVLDLVPKTGVTTAEVKPLTDILLTHIFKYMPSGYALIDRANRDSLLKEQQFAVSDASDTLSSTIQIGKLLSALLVVSGSISKIGTQYHITCNLIEVASGLVKSSSYQRSRSSERITATLEACVAALFGRSPPSDYKVENDNIITYRDGFIPYINADVVSLKFFESARTGQLAGSPNYRTKFQQLVTRCIFWELILENPPLAKDTELEIISVWFAPGGDILARAAQSWVVSKGNSLHSTTSGWGYDEMGKWSPGTYRLDLYIGGDRVVSGLFEIVR
jgi:hypothetical protein